MLFWVLLTNLAATWFMVGVIWWVQLVHYPLFAYVDNEAWPRYHNEHTTRTGRLLIGVMFAELITAGWLCMLDGPSPIWMPWVAFGAVAMLWLSTFAWQVPLHARLSRNDRKAGRTLVLSNWLRTVLWTLRGVLVLAMVHAMIA